MFVSGLTLVGFSLPTAIYMLTLLIRVGSNPRAYRFTNGFTEESVAIIAIVATIATAVGFCLMIFGWIKQKNNATLQAIKNQAGRNQVSGSYCSVCNTNVVSKDGKCPLCGKNLNER